jgi:DNA-binding transcriptional MerR regulator
VAIRKPAAEHETKLYRSISEVGEMLDVKPHVLRYWETQFSMLRPTKNRAGNRMYRPDEVKMLLRIKELLYARRYTIEGARRTLLGERREESPQVELGFDTAERQMLMIEVKEGLRELVARLRARPGAPRRDSEPTPVG